VSRIREEPARRLAINTDGNDMMYLFKLSSVIFLVLLTTIGLFAQDVIADNGMVASAHPLASQAGIEILHQGGNAVDAAVATALALSVVEPNASGLGGGGFVVLKMADSDESVTIDYREIAPQKAVADFYYSDSSSFSHLTKSGPNSIGVPGAPAGLSLALEKYGTMNFSQVLKPAITLAEEGFEISPNFENIIFNAYELILANPATASIYLMDDLPAPAGTLIKNTDLANTLRLLSDKGVNEFYNGALANKISAYIQQQGGIIQEPDLAVYKALIKQPVYGEYRGFQIFSSAPSAGGGTHLVELLNILEGFNLKKMKNAPAKYLHIFAESLKMVLMDKAYNMADPEFYYVPVEELISKKHAEEIRNHINFTITSSTYKAPVWLSRESGSTTHLSVVDRKGNIVALTQSINAWFGSGITIPGTGIIMNNHLADFDSEAGHPNSIEPGKRPVSSIAPTILLKDEKPFLTIGTPGGSRIIGVLAQIIVNIIDFDMTIDEAIEAPRIHVENNILHIEGRVSESVIESLKKMGHSVKLHPDFDNYFGGAQGIFVNPETAKRMGGADSRRDGVVIGY